MRYEAIQRHRDQYQIRPMCRCMKVSSSGFHDWCDRQPSVRARDNTRLLTKIRVHHAASDGVMGAPRMHEMLCYEGETANLNQIARLMSSDGLAGVPQRRRWRHKPSSTQPSGKRLRGIRAQHPVGRGHHLYPYRRRLTLPMRGAGPIFGQGRGVSIASVQDRHLVLKAVMMACWQRSDRSEVILHSDRGT